MKSISKQSQVLLPLLHVLESLKHEKRVIIFAHLDSQTQDAICRAIAEVLRSEKIPIRKRINLREKIKSAEEEFRYLADTRKSSKQKRKKLTQVGGGPMTHMIKATIPVMMHIFD